MESYFKNLKKNETQCFFCGKNSTGKEKECRNPICIEKYRKVKEEKRHPFFV